MKVATISCPQDHDLGSGFYDIITDSQSTVKHLHGLIYNCAIISHSGVGDNFRWAIINQNVTQSTDNLYMDQKDVAFSMNVFPWIGASNTYHSERDQYKFLVPFKFEKLYLGVWINDVSLDLGIKLFYE